MWTVAVPNCVGARHVAVVYSRPRRHIEEAVHVIIERLGLCERREAGNVIVATAPRSLDSWGEDIAIQLEDLGEATRVIYQTQPRWSTTLFDWGKGKRNLEGLMNGVDRLLSQ